jgi:hypothetical protein
MRSGMVRPRVLLVMLGIPGALVVACGGAVVATEADPSARDDAPSRPSRPAKPFDASPRDVAVDVIPGDCACTDEIVQVEGTCSFTIAPRIVACVAEHSPETGYRTLDLWRSCSTTNAPPSWSPSAKPTELDLCSCVPGEKHALCVRYL